MLCVFIERNDFVRIETNEREFESLHIETIKVKIKRMVTISSVSYS